MMTIKNEKVREVKVDPEEDDSWTHIRHNISHLMSSLIPREHIFEITAKTIVTTDRKDMRVKENVLSDIIDLLEKWKKEGNENWATKFMENMIDERIKKVENLIIIRKMDCDFIREERKPIYKGNEHV